MAHVNLVDPAQSSAAVKPTLDRIKGAFGVVPNMFKAVANSPAALAFSVKLVENRAAVDAADVAALREVGYDDEAIVEILAHVALNSTCNDLRSTELVGQRAHASAVTGQRRFQIVELMR